MPLRDGHTLTVTPIESFPGFALLPLRDLQKEEAKLMEAYAAGDERLLQHSPITWDSWWYA